MCCPVSLAAVALLNSMARARPLVSEAGGLFSSFIFDFNCALIVKKALFKNGPLVNSPSKIENSIESEIRKRAPGVTKLPGISLGLLELLEAEAACDEADGDVSESEQSPVGAGGIS